MDVFSTAGPAETAGLKSVVAFVANAFATKPTFASDEGNAAFPVRLVEFRPAWALHALLRFRGITYLNENLPIPVSMGQNLPLVVDGQHLLGEGEALEHYGLRAEESPVSEKEQEAKMKQLEDLGVLLRYLKYRNGREDMMEIRRACGPYCPTSWEAQIRHISQKTFTHDSAARTDMASLDTSEILTRLQIALGDADNLLAKNGGFLTGRLGSAEEDSRSSSSSSSSSKQRKPVARSDVAEAVLFGHTCDILCSSIASVVNSRDYPHLVAFVTAVFEDYFEMTVIPPIIDHDSTLKSREDKRKKVIEWRRSSDLILQNAFVSTLPEHCLVPSLLAQKTKYTTLDERSEQAWRRLMALTSTPSTSETPENDRTASRWTSIRFSTDSLLTKLLRKAFFAGPSDVEIEDKIEALERDKEGVVTMYPGGLVFLSAVGFSFIGYLTVAWGLSQGWSFPSRLDRR